MPTYDYMCDNEKCGYAREFTHKMDEPGPGRCDNCDTGKYRKKLGVVAFNLKTSLTNKARRKKYKIKCADGSTIDTPGRMV